MTSLLDGILALVIAMIANFFVALQIRSKLVPDEARFLVKVYTLTVLLRYGLALILNAFAADSAFAGTFWGDSGTYDTGGYLLARKWSGEPISSVYLSTAVSGYGWSYFVGVVYYVLGRNQLCVQFLNGLIGAVTVLVIYAIASELFGRTAARWAALLMAFFPQMVFWSAGMYKDPAILLCIALCMYAVIRLCQRLSARMLVLFIVSELVLITLRFYVAYFVAFAGLATFLFIRQRGIVRTLVTYGLLLGLFFGAVTLAVRRETLEEQASFMTLERLQVTREDQATWGRSGFGRGHDVSTPAGAIAALPMGLVYLLFAPFPWAISGVRQALAVPETLVWYALMPAFIRGLALAIRYRIREVLPIVVFATTLTAAYAIMQGNVGTAYRQRTQVTMFFFVFMAAGIAERQRRRVALSATASSPAVSQEV